MPLHECPSQEHLGRYVLGDLEDELAQTINVHLGTCTVCLGLLDRLSTRSDGLIDALRKPARPAPPHPPALAGAIEAVLAGKAPRAAAESDGLEAGTVLNGYRILEELGHGGMGRVYRAVHPRLDQEVALKVLRSGIGLTPGHDRFEAELRALTRMDHPHVARVLDGGATDDGRPFLVMELVRGTVLTRYTDEHRLTIRQRLELFISICHAVQHAHQKGIIHRDLKPSNVLVAEYGGKPAPKVIDFGVAKVIDRTAERTEVGMIVGTLETMSPEQAGLDSSDIDTRSDVYSLGVVLYELLIGVTPVGDLVRQKPILEVLRVLREDEAIAPSVRLSNADDAETIAQCRATNARELWKQVRGELDWIVLKALDKDRARRYQTAVALADDVQRFLSDQPVTAGPPSRAYLAKKFVRRNRGAVLAAVLVAVTLVVGIVGTSLGLMHAEREREIAEKERDKKITALADLEKQQLETQKALAAETRALANVEKQQAKTKAALSAETVARRHAMMTLRTLTDDVVQRQMEQRTLTDEDRQFLRDIQQQYEAFAALPGEEVEQRAVRAEGHQRVGLIRLRLGDVKEADVSYRKALDHYQRLVADFPARADFRRELATVHNIHGLLLRAMAKPDDAETAFKAAVDIYRQLVAEFAERLDYWQELAGGHTNLGLALRDKGQLPEAEIAFRDSVTILKQIVSQSRAKTSFRLALGRAYHNQGNLYRSMKQIPAAETAYRNALEIQEQLYADFPTQTDVRRDVAVTHNSLGSLLRATKKSLKDAETAFSKARSIQLRLAAEFPGRAEFRHELALTHNNFGLLYRDTNRPKGAEASYLAALTLRKQLIGEFPKTPDYRNELAGTLVNLANLASNRPDFAQARRWLEEAHPHHLMALKTSPKHPTYRDYYRNNLVALARSCAGDGDRDAAVKAAGKIRDLGWDPPSNAYEAARTLASCIAFVGKDEKEKQFYADEAVAELRTAIARGYRNVAQIKTDIAWNPLRQRADFKQLLNELGPN